MFTAALLLTANRWGEPKCPSTDRRINELWSVLTMAYEWPTRRNEALTHTTWWTLIMCSAEKPQRTTECVIPFTWQNRVSRETQTDERLSRVWRRGGRHEVFFRGGKNVLKLGCANDYTTLRIQGLKTVNCHHYFFWIVHFKCANCISIWIIFQKGHFLNKTNPSWELTEPAWQCSPGHMSRL